MILKEDILKIAKLAKLSFEDDELEKLTIEMDRIVNFANEINEANKLDIEFDGINGLSNSFRDDIVKKSFKREEILKNVDGGEDGFFVVRKRA